MFSEGSNRPWLMVPFRYRKVLLTELKLTGEGLLMYLLEKLVAKAMFGPVFDARYWRLPTAWQYWNSTSLSRCNICGDLLLRGSMGVDWVLQFSILILFKIALVV